MKEKAEREAKRSLTAGGGMSDALNTVNSATPGLDTEESKEL